MYQVNRTFDQARIGRTYTKGEQVSLDELTGSEIKRLVSSSWVSPVRKKRARRIKREKDAEDSSA